jgi:putative transposase
MFKVQKNKMKLDKSQYRFWRDMCRRSKNLFNSTMWHTNDHFDRCGEFLTYNSAYHVMKDKPEYKALGTDASQQTMKVVERCFRSFFGLLKKKQHGNYNKPVKKPHFLPKEGHFLCIFPQRNCTEHFSVSVPKDLRNKYLFKKFVCPLPPNVKGHKMKEVRILPKNRAEHFEIEFVYEVEQEHPKLEKSRVLSIDPGVNNFATCLDSKTGRSFILDGRGMKAINQWYNKERARLQSILETQGQKSSKRMRAMEAKRNRRLNEYLNQYVNLIVNTCVENQIGKVVIGEGWHAQDGSHIGDKNNQNFVMLPFGKFAWKLRSKCELYGIEYKSINEAYTSKCDHLANEPMCHHEEYMGTRRPRGLFKSSTGIVLNADMHGALGIMLKSGMGKSLRTQLSRGVVNTPSRIRLDEIHSFSCKRLAENILSSQSKPLLSEGKFNSGTSERKRTRTTIEPL